MGETTLLEYALRSAADMRTVRLVGVQSDSGFGFGALHRLFIPFMDRIGSLPDRQRDAIGPSGVVDGPLPDRFWSGWQL